MQRIHSTLMDLEWQRESSSFTYEGSMGEILDFFFFFFFL